MKVSHGSTVYGARRCKDAREREVRSMVTIRGVRGDRRGEKKKEYKDGGAGKEDGGRC